MKKKIKIMRIQSRISIGGPAIHTILLSSELDQSRFETILVGGRMEKDEKAHFDLIRKQGLDLRIIGSMGRKVSPWSDLVSLGKLFLLIRKEKPRIVHTHTAKAGALGRLAAWLNRVPVIIHTYHGHVFENYFNPLVTRIYVLIERMLARLSSRIIVISPCQYRDICQKYRIAPESKTEIIPLGFDLRKFTNARALNLRRKLGLGKNSFLVAIIGRFVPIKNHMFFLKAAEKIAGSVKDVYFIIAGDGEERAGIQSFIREKDLAGRIFLLGWQGRIERLYPDFNAVALTSLNEGTPVSLIEAMASGIPVVSTDAGGVRDIVRNNWNGFLVPRGDLDGFVNKIMLLYRSGKTRERFSQNGRKFVWKTFDKRLLLTRISRVYQDCLRNGRAGKE